MRVEVAVPGWQFASCGSSRLRGNICHPTYKSAAAGLLCWYTAAVSSAKRSIARPRNTLTLGRSELALVVGVAQSRVLAAIPAIERGGLAETREDEPIYYA